MNMNTYVNRKMACLMMNSLMKLSYKNVLIRLIFYLDVNFSVAYKKIIWNYRWTKLYKHIIIDIYYKVTHISNISTKKSWLWFFILFWISDFQASKRVRYSWKKKLTPAGHFKMFCEFYDKGKLIKFHAVEKDRH